MEVEEVEEEGEVEVELEVEEVVEEEGDVAEGVEEVEVEYPRVREILNLMRMSPKMLVKSGQGRTP
jgi:hypothetical protein